MGLGDSTLRGAAIPSRPRGWSDRPAPGTTAAAPLLVAEERVVDGEHPLVALLDGEGRENARRGGAAAAGVHHLETVAVPFVLSVFAACDRPSFPSRALDGHDDCGFR